MTFKALLATKAGKTVSTEVVDFDEADLMPGEVSVPVDYSTVNYKDALARSGRSRSFAYPRMFLASTWLARLKVRRIRA